MTITDTALADVDPAEVLAGGPTLEARDDRLEGGAATLATKRSTGSLILHERFLVAVAGAFMTAGLTAIILGWVGASRSILVVKQIPYLISGGLLGVALATIGGLLFFTHWLAAILRENRFQHQELVRVLQEERDDRAVEREALLSAIRELQPTAPAARRRVRKDA